MEYLISDLLDDLAEVPIDIQPNITASRSRIKELTMKKIQERGKYEARPRGLGFGKKLLIAAAIITALAVPAMAVSGVWFFDWLAVTDDKKLSQDYDMEVAIGSGSKTWDISGWFIEMTPEEVTSTGMTLRCDEFSIEPHSDKLITDESYWIEKWNGTDYEKLEADVPEGTTCEVQQRSSNRWVVDWSGTYGSLDSGYYRLAKTFTCGGENGDGDSAVFYAKFRIFTEEMEPYIRKCNDSLEVLIAADSWHMTWTEYRIYDNEGEYNYDRSEMEIWKSGEDYLLMDTCFELDGSVRMRHGYMLRDGKGYYDLRWAGDTVDSELLDWQNGDFVNHRNFDLWPELMNIWEAIVGQVCDNGNQIIAIEYHAPVGGGESVMSKEEILEKEPYAFHDYTEKTFTFDENGDLRRIHTTVQTAPDVPDGEKVLYHVLEVHDTPANEIASVIKKQNVSNAKSFSYSKDYEIYKDMGRTEGFVNTKEISMEDVDAVIARARRETDPKKDPQYRDGFIYNCAEAFYDSEKEMWKVDFWHSQDSWEKNFRQIVYLNNQGVTELVVYPIVPKGTFGSFLWEYDYSQYSEKSVLDGFKNTKSHPVSGPKDAMQLAYQEADPKAHPNYVEGATFSKVWAAFYDVEEDMWRVVMWCKEHEGMVCNVYLNGDGITQMVYYEDIP